MAPIQSESKLTFFEAASIIVGAGADISGDGALVDPAAHLGGWVSVAGYVFTLLALCTLLATVGAVLPVQ